MSEEITVSSVEHQRGYWSVDLSKPPDERGLHVGTWRGHDEAGITITARTSRRFRQIADALNEAADMIDGVDRS